MATHKNYLLYQFSRQNVNRERCKVCTLMLICCVMLTGVYVNNANRILVAKTKALVPPSLTAMFLIYKGGISIMVFTCWLYKLFLYIFLFTF